MDKKEFPLKLRLYRTLKNALSFLKKEKAKKDNSRFSKLTVRYTMEWDELTREYYVYALVRRDNTELAPLYVGLHGLTGVVRRKS